MFAKNVLTPNRQMITAQQSRNLSQKVVRKSKDEHSDNLAKIKKQLKSHAAQRKKLEDDVLSLKTTIQSITAEIR